MGHLDATRSNIRSTKVPFVSEANHPHKIPLLWVDLHKSTGRLHSDQTGELPVLGKHKERYLAIFFDEESNYIHAEAIKELSGVCLTSATKLAIDFFASRGSKQKELRLDNQISESVRDLLKEKGMKIDITPVGQHRRNKTERAIRTLKTIL
jgi:hypothetical protein